MKTNKKSCSTLLASMIMILFLILTSSMATADPEESSSSMGPYAYITNYGSNNISVIDTSNDTVIATINDGNYPEAVAVNPTGTKVYVANRNSGIISVIDTATNTITGTVSVGSYPIGVAVNPTGTKVYVTNRDSNNVSVIDVTTNTVTATVDVEFPHGVVVNPAGTKVYVTRELASIVSVIDVATNTVTANISVGSYPVEVEVSLDGTKLYAVNQEGTVSVIDTNTNTVIATINIGEGNYPLGVAVTPDGTKVYVTNSGSSTVSVIDTVTNNVVATVAVGNYPFGVSVTPDGTKVYVANSYNNTVSVIDTATNNVTDTINVGSEPRAFGKFIGPLRVHPVANFSSNVTEGYAPLSVQFTDLSENATVWYWDFGDVSNSTEQNPTHTYSTAGNYTVNLTVSNAVGNNTLTKYEYIRVAPSLTQITYFEDGESTANWTNMSGGMIESSAARVYSGNHSFKYTDLSATKYNDDCTFMLPVETTNATVEWYANPSQNKTYSRLTILDGNASSKRGPWTVFGDNGQIQYWDEASWHNVKRYSAGNWYHFKLVVKSGTKYDLYVDDTLVASDINTQNPAKVYDRVVIFGFNVAGSSCYYDNINITVPRG